MKTSSDNYEAYATNNTTLLTLVNKLDEDCNITITYERTHKDTLLVSTLTESYKIYNDEEISIRVNTQSSLRKPWILYCLVIRLSCSCTKVRFRIDKDTTANIVSGPKGIILNSMTLCRQYIYL
jgi:hypothetical protein